MWLYSHIYMLMDPQHHLIHCLWQAALHYLDQELLRLVASAGQQHQYAQLAGYAAMYIRIYAGMNGMNNDSESLIIH